MKAYFVWYIVKKGGHGYLYEHRTMAANKKDAFQSAREDCKRRHNAHAFTLSTTGPKYMAGIGAEYNGMTYTKAYLIRNQIVLW